MSGNRSLDRIGLRAPIVMVVLAATAIPVELLPHGQHNPLDIGIKTADTVANIVGYIPVGIVLGQGGWLRSVISAAVMTLFAECSQRVMVYRDPSIVDFTSNVIGAMIGATVSTIWSVRGLHIRVNGRTVAIAGIAASAVPVGVWATSTNALNPRGAAAPGALEARWTFDDAGGRTVDDVSGHGLNGRVVHNPERVAGVDGSGIKLDGVKDYIDFGRSKSFRLVGNMTVAAWIKSASYPVDDAPIVSNLNHIPGLSDAGFQLDTTIDVGPRTIGFKLADACGHEIARYGATPLRLDTWYHVAGVYDAAAQTIDVYLNGKLDNGDLFGFPGAARRSSNTKLYVGTRSDVNSFFFAGVIDDVRLYSAALSRDEIRALVRQAHVDRLQSGESTGQPTHSGGVVHNVENRRTPCVWWPSSEVEDARIPGAVAIFGVLVAVVFIGCWPSAAKWQCLVVCGVAARLLLVVASGTLPSLNAWTFPLTGMAAGASVVLSRRRREDPVLPREPGFGGGGSLPGTNKRPTKL
jgi:VanZ family protein